MVGWAAGGGGGDGGGHCCWRCCCSNCLDCSSLEMQLNMGWDYLEAWVSSPLLKFVLCCLLGVVEKGQKRASEGERKERRKKERVEKTKREREITQ